MSELRRLADAKIDAERAKLLAALHDRVETLKAKQAAAGVLMSGITLLLLVKVFAEMLESLRDVIATQYQWAITESLFSTQSYVEDLVVASREQVAMLRNPCNDRLVRESRNISAPPTATEECTRKLDAKSEEVCGDIALALRSKFAELKNRRIRGIWEAATGWITKLLGRPT